MTERHVEIELTGRTGRLVLDGHDMTNAVQGFTLYGGHNDLPQLRIDAAVFTVNVGHIESAQVAVHMPDEARELLIKQGWTPPPND